MLKAFDMAHEALQAGEVPIGCVLLLPAENDEPTTTESKPAAKYQVLAQGHNQVNEERNATRHAEMVAFDRAIEWIDAHHGRQRRESIFRRSILVVTCEPCIMCAEAIAQVGVSRCFFGCWNERFGGCGSVLSVHEDRFKVEGGIMKDEAISLLRQFYQRENANAPESVRRQKSIQRLETGAAGHVSLVDSESCRSDDVMDGTKAERPESPSASKPHATGI